MSTWADEDRFYEETEAILRIGITVWDTKPRSASVQVEGLEKNGLDRNVEDAKTAEGLELLDEPYDDDEAENNSMLEVDDGLDEDESRERDIAVSLGYSPETYTGLDQGRRVWKVLTTLPDGQQTVTTYETEEAAMEAANDWIAREDTSVVRESLIEVSGPGGKVVGLDSPDPPISRDDIVKAVEIFTGRNAYIEHAGGGLEYLYVALDNQGNYAWLGWSDSWEASPATADDPTGREVVVSGAIYRLSYTTEYPEGIADTYFGLEDAAVTDSGLRVAVLKWVARAMAANIDPATKWESI